jgi:hypothetical protein
MNKDKREFKRNWRSLTAGLAIVCLGAAFAQHANAGCLDFRAPKKAVSFETPREFFGSLSVMQVSDDKFWESEPEDNYRWEPSVRRAPIVGLWSFKYLSKGNWNTLGIPDGAVVDGGATLWFADGNESTLSGVRAPDTGDVCLGVWKRTGEWTYELNHLGLSWDPVKKEYAGPAFIKQHVTLSEDKNSYTGTFTINQLGPDGKTPALPALIKGTIVAKRVTLDTDTLEALP